MVRNPAFNLEKQLKSINIRQPGINVFPGGRRGSKPVQIVRTNSTNSTPRFVSSILKASYYLETNPVAINRLIVYAKEKNHLSPKNKITENHIKQGLIVFSEQASSEDLSFYDAFNEDIACELYNLHSTEDIVGFCNKYGLLFDQPFSNIFAAKVTGSKEPFILNVTSLNDVLKNHYFIPYAMFLSDFVYSLKQFKWAFEYVQAIKKRDRSDLVRRAYKSLVCESFKNKNRIMKVLLNKPHLVNEVFKILNSNDFNIVFVEASGLLQSFIQPFLQRIRQKVIFQASDSAVATEESGTKPSENNSFYPSYIFKASNLIDVAYQQLYWQLIKPSMENCDTCGKPFVPKRKDKRYCSAKCRNKEPAKKFNEKRRMERLRLKQKQQKEVVNN